MASHQRARASAPGKRALEHENRGTYPDSSPGQEGNARKTPEAQICTWCWRVSMTAELATREFQTATKTPRHEAATLALFCTVRAGQLFLAQDSRHQTQVAVARH